MQKNNLLEKDVAITVPIEKEVTKVISYISQFTDSARCMQAHYQILWIVFLQENVCKYEKFNHDSNKFILLLQKGVYCYEYMDRWKKFDKISLPGNEDFYSHCKNYWRQYWLCISDHYADFAHSKRVWNKKFWRNIMICMLRWYIIVSWCVRELYNYVSWNIWSWPCKISFSSWISIASSFKKD